MHFTKNNSNIISEDSELQNLFSDDDFTSEEGIVDDPYGETAVYQHVPIEEINNDEPSRKHYSSAAAKAIYCDDDDNYQSKIYDSSDYANLQHMNRRNKAQWIVENEQSSSTISENDVQNHDDTDNKNSAIPKVRFKYLNKFLVGLIVIFIIITTISGVSIWNFMNDDHITTATAETVTSKTFGASEEDIAKLAEQGYNAETLTKKAQDFVELFLTVNADNIKDNSWSNSFINMVDYGSAENLHSENMLTLRDSDRWKEMFDNHPYYATELIDCKYISWYITYYNDEPLPYCDITVEIIRPDLDFYTINSVPLIFSRYEDTYRITFNKNEEVIKVKRVNAQLLEANIDATNTLLNSEAAKAYVEAFISNGNANTIQGIADLQAQQAAEEEALRQAMEEAEKQRLEAEEEQKRLEEEKKQQEQQANQNNKPNQGNHNSNGNNNSNGNSNNNTNNGGNSTPPANNSTPSVTPPPDNASDGGSEGADANSNQ